MRTAKGDVTRSERKRQRTPFYRLLQVVGCTDPMLVGKLVPTWEALGDEIRKLMKAGKVDEEDGLFYIELDGEGRFKNIGSFSGGYMDNIRETLDFVAKEKA